VSRAGAAALLLLLAAPAVAAESPSPAPEEDRTTSVAVSPASAADRGTFVLRGYSDCAVIDGHLLFRSYDGKADNVVARSTSKTYDYSREKYPYVVRVTVPAHAAPGPAQVYAAPFCGPPEEYPTSETLAVRIARGQLALRLSDRRLDVGDRLRVRVSGCDGTRGRLTVRVQVGGDTRDVPAAVVSGAASARVTLRTAGTGTVSLPRAATECRGSRAAAPVPFAVRGAATVASASASPSASEVPASAPASPAPMAASASASSSPSAAPAAAPRRKRDGGVPVLPVVLAVLAAAGAAGAVLLRRSR
jgi:hypothetical protein